MLAIVVMTGDVDERDVWPYAVWTDSDGASTTLTVRVHDSQEFVGVLVSMTALGLEVRSARLIEEHGGGDAAGGDAHMPRSRGDRRHRGGVAADPEARWRGLPDHDGAQVYLPGPRQLPAGREERARNQPLAVTDELRPGTRADAGGATE